MKLSNTILREIKKILTKRGWTKYTLRSSNGSCCLMGAWAEAEGKPVESMKFNYDWFKTEANQEVGDMLRKCISTLGKPHDEDLSTNADLHGFNDYVKTSKQDVLEVVECAIKRTE